MSRLPARLWLRWCALPWNTSVLLAVAWTIAWSLVFMFVAFDRTPHIPDGATYLFQAKIFASGHLTARVPPLADFFTGGEMVALDGRWFGKYPPGQSLLLLPGVLLGVPWLMSPLCAGAVVAGTGVLARRWTNEATARLALLLAASSPFLLTHGGMYLAHISAAAILVWWVIGLDRLFSEKRGVVVAIVCGVAIGFVLWIRPYTAVALASPAIVFCVMRFLRPEAGDRLRILGIAAGGLVMVALLLAYNNATTGSPLLFGYHIGALAETARLGFQPYPRGDGYVMYTPARALQKTIYDLWWLHTEPLGPPFPVLALALIPLCIGGRKKAFRLAAFPLAAVVFHFFYYYSDNNHGPRMYLEATPFLIVLAAAGCLVVAERTPARAGIVGIALALVWGIIVPQKIVRYGGNYAGLPNVARPFTRDLDRALVFLDTNHILAQQNHLLYLNTPTLDGPVVFARDLGPEQNMALVAQYPERSTYRLRYWIAGEMTHAQIVGPTFRRIDPAAEAQRAKEQATQPSQADIIRDVFQGAGS